MKISPVPSISVPTLGSDGNPQPSRVESIRALKMTTNATPLANMQMPQELPIAAPNEQTEATVEATQPLSPQLALLAKQRRALQVKERELKEREKALQAQGTGNTAVDIARLKSEPLSVLLENGVTYDQLTEAILANQGNSEINALKSEIESLKQGIDQKFQEKESAAEKQVLAEMQREAEQLVRSDDYELVREMKRIPDVMSLIERTYRETGEVMEVPEALQWVEKFLLEEAQGIAKAKKIQSLLNPMPQIPQPQQRQMGMRTLTNKDTASVPLSAKARAMAAFYGTLKK